MVTMSEVYGSRIPVESNYIRTVGINAKTGTKVDVIRTAIV